MGKSISVWQSIPNGKGTKITIWNESQTWSRVYRNIITKLYKKSSHALSFGEFRKYLFELQTLIKKNIISTKPKMGNLIILVRKQNR